MAGNTLNNLIRVGIISSVDGEKATVRVAFKDKDNLVSHDLPVLQQGNGSYWMPAPGDQAVCLFLANGIAQGFCLGTIYSEPSPPPVSDPTQRVISSQGNLKIAAAGTDLSSCGTMTGNLSIKGNISASGTIMDAAGNSNHHTH